MNVSEKHYTFLNQQLEALNSRDFDDGFNKKNSKKSRYLGLLVFSIIDLFLLIIKLSFSKSRKSYNIIYTAKGFCTKVNGILEDRILLNISIDNRIYINQGKESNLKSIDGQKVYNIGIVVKFVALFVRKKNKSKAFLKAYSVVNDLILFIYKSKNVYFLCYYDLNGLSLVFSKHRKKIKLFEIQHGSMINYYPYLLPSQVKVADVFYVKNQETITYLKQHLNKNFPDIQYELIEYPKSSLFFKKGIHILYASTVEFNGIHPVFMDYLRQITENESTTINIRLHPREKNKKDIFINQLRGINANVIFDESKNWLESNTIRNLIVVSPWSSVIEDAVDNNYKAIIIDALGAKRFQHIINNRNVIFANDVSKFLAAINHDI